MRSRVSLSLRNPAMCRSVSLSALGALAVLAGCGPASHAAPPDLARLALQRADLPRGATAGPAHSWSNAQAARRDGVPVSVYNAHCRIRSYTNTFYRELVGGNVPTGIVRADSEVTRFRSPADARWGFASLARTLRHGTTVPGATTGGTHAGEAVHLWPYRSVQVKRVGDAAAGFTVDWEGDEFAYTTRAVVFRQGLYVGLVRIAGFQGQTPVAQAVGLARRVDARIRGLG